MKMQFSKIMCFALLVLGCTIYGQQAKKDKKAASIDLTHWKITIPEEDPKEAGSPIEIGYPEIMDYATNPVLKKWMYNDEKDKSIVFYAYPSGTTTANSHYSRSELRETIDPNNNNVNWTFAQGGTFKATYAMDAISRGKDGKYNKVIIAQIHGRLTNAQRELIGQKDNNAAPMLKIYWDDGKIRVKTKVLKNPKASDIEMLPVSAWTDDEGISFKEKVDFDKFTIEVKISNGRMEVILNGTETLVYNDINIKKWGIFENYFKAGNYFQSKEPGTYAKVKIYALTVSH
ncbi:polysaccharide lyase family 7 protein [Flavobacterium nackdongense]|uniref:Polysaccharide lyase family 7 protein n=1 Tax=Flavobacterium nackdongense TaxID=2547394 RepID=A0A4V1AGB5_9FLAO|nr:polysaccharide lyase family 7 protein [Flavobacterium nackdongense]QBN17462.1 polysaccharide lyase family 7 protein [Flavobacterium nackdongense]